MQNKDIKSGFSAARLITRKHAKTFYFASKFLPAEQTKAAYAVYAICRIGDDSVDTGKDTREKLARVQADIAAAYQGRARTPLLAAFQATVNKYKIPRRYFDELISGLRLDLEKNNYANDAELAGYCYKVAGVVGLMMLEIFGYTAPPAKEHAAKLGIAMQITNILRDIKEDFARGRIYLAQEQMRRFGVDRNHLAAGRVDKNFKDIVKFYIAAARNYYAAAEGGIKLLNNRRARFVVCLMSKIYAGILTAIEKNGYDVFSQRAGVNRAGKLQLLTKTISEGKYL